MPKVIETTAYQFDELSDEAKKKARDWYREAQDNDPSDLDFVIEDFVAIGEMLGITFDTYEVQLYGGGKRQDPKVWWSLSYSQGDGACFEGIYDYRADACTKIREHAPLDTELHRIADGLAEIQRANAFGLHAEIEKIDSHYSHENTVSIEVTDARDEDHDVEDAADKLDPLLRDLMRWLHKALQEEYESRQEDEFVDDQITANEYLFDEEGDRHAYA